MENQEMARSFFKSLVEVLTPKAELRRDYYICAKTEYGSDWQYAYNHMIAHNGKAPKYGKSI